MIRKKRRSKKRMLYLIPFFLLIFYIFWFNLSPDIDSSWVKITPDGKITEGFVTESTDGAEFTGQAKLISGLLIEKTSYGFISLYYREEENENLSISFYKEQPHIKEARIWRENLDNLWIYISYQNGGFYTSQYKANEMLRTEFLNLENKIEITIYKNDDFETPWTGYTGTIERQGDKEPRRLTRYREGKIISSRLHFFPEEEAALMEQLNTWRQAVNEDYEANTIQKIKDKQLEMTQKLKLPDLSQATYQSLNKQFFTTN